MPGYGPYEPPSVKKISGSPDPHGGRYRGSNFFLLTLPPQNSLVKSVQNCHTISDFLSPRNPENLVKVSITVFLPAYFSYFTSISEYRTVNILETESWYSDRYSSHKLNFRKSELLKLLGQDLLQDARSPCDHNKSVKILKNNNINYCYLFII